MAKKPSRTVPAGVFKATCLAILDDVAKNNETVIITKRGKAIARLGPLSAKARGPLAGSIVFESDLMSPIAAEWNAID